MTNDMVIVIISGLVAFWMAWGIGANDLANIMSTTMGSKAVSVKQALAIAVVFEFLGALFGGASVSATVRSGIIDLASVKIHPDLFVYSMLAVLLSGSTWITIASIAGMPVSITQAIIGSLVGVGCFALGSTTIAWGNVCCIFVGWLLAPLLAGLVAFCLFSSIKKWVFAAKNHLSAARYAIPGYFFVVSIVLSMMTVVKIMVHYQHDLGILWQAAVVIGTSVLLVVLGMLILKRIKSQRHNNIDNQLHYVEQLFSVLMGFTACAMVFAHGSNDVAIAISPAIAITNTVLGDKYFNSQYAISGSLCCGCIGVILGLLMYGRKVIATVGHGITVLTPSRAFAATFSAATIVVTATTFGLPVSVTQTLVGAVLGVGMARGIEALNIDVIRNIVLSWLLTVPISASLAILFFIAVHKFIPFWS